MAHTFEFAVLRVMPDAIRAETVNVGLVVFKPGGTDVRVGEILTRARAIYPELTGERLRQAVDVYLRLGSVDMSASDRHRTLSHVGPFILGELSSFTIEANDPTIYEGHLARLMRMFVGASKRAPTGSRPKSRLVTDIRKAFRREKVLAPVGDATAIDDHKIVPEWPIPGALQLRADLALKNRLMRVCEIVDVELATDSPPPPALFAGVVTLDEAKRTLDAQQRVFAYRARGAKAKIDEMLNLAHEHASEVVNWEDTVARESFLHTWIVAARQPISVGAH